tara:strand:- start:1489 stop:2526 length:1038 start_codon:yes stop_codon:yes gene_type:complete
MEDQLKNLSDPTKSLEPISLIEHDIDSLKKMLKDMMLIRRTEQELAQRRKDGLIGGPVHLAAGQEAVAVGVSKYLKKTDSVFGAHRSHSHILALNPDFYRLFAEILGKKTGFSKGMGGSMHLWDQPSGFYGSVPIVAGTVPLAVGAGLAAKLKGTTDIGVAYIGDGAVEEGVVHESLNFARLQDAPVLFVIENNLFASHMHISLRQPSNMVSRFATANNIPFKLLDGNDVVSVASESKKMIDSIRRGDGPRLIELITYRLYGHVDWREDIDVGVKRSIEDINNWKKRDPIKRLSDAMIKANIWTKEEQNNFDEKLLFEIKNAWEKAMDDPYPDQNATLDYVYSIN